MASTNWVEVRCGDAVSIPYPDAAFDAIFMCFVLEIFTPAEIRRPIPVERLLAQAGFWIAEADRGPMCGLPFAVVLARRG